MKLRIHQSGGGSPQNRARYKHASIIYLTNTCYATLGVRQI
jgi:hypothetical protein